MRAVKKVFSTLALAFFVLGLAIAGWNYFMNRSAIRLINKKINEYIVNAGLQGAIRWILIGIVMILIALVFCIISLKLGGIVRKQDKARREEEKEQKQLQEERNKQIQKEADEAKKEAEEAKAEAQKVQEQLNAMNKTTEAEVVEENKPE